MALEGEIDIGDGADPNAGEALVDFADLCLDLVPVLVVARRDALGNDLTDGEGGDDAVGERLLRVEQEEEAGDGDRRLDGGAAVVGCRLDAHGIVGVISRRVPQDDIGGDLRNQFGVRR